MLDVDLLRCGGAEHLNGCAHREVLRGVVGLLPLVDQLALVVFAAGFLGVEHAVQDVERLHQRQPGGVGDALRLGRPVPVGVHLESVQFARHHLFDRLGREPKLLGFLRYPLLVLPARARPLLGVEFPDVSRGKRIDERRAHSEMPRLSSAVSRRAIDSPCSPSSGEVHESHTFMSLVGTL